MIVLQSACLQGVAFDSDLIGFRGAARECQTESEPGDTTCFAKLFTGLRGEAADLLTVAQNAQAELERRAIHGRCLVVLGTSPGALATLRAVRDAAADAASALSSRDGPDYAADVRRIDASLRARDGERYEGSGRRAILTCPHT